MTSRFLLHRSASAVRHSALMLAIGRKIKSLLVLPLVVSSAAGGLVFGREANTLSNLPISTAEFEKPEKRRKDIYSYHREEWNDSAV